MSDVKVTVITPLMVLKSLFLEQYEKGYHAINPVFSGFNEYLRKQCSIADPRTFTNELKEKGLIEVRGNKTVKDGRTTKSVLFWLTEKGQAEFGIRPPSASTKAPARDAKVDKLVADAKKRFHIA